MNNNFANWEVTKLLPDNPSFLSITTKAYIFKDQGIGEGDFIVIFDSESSKSPDDYDCPYLQAWTWEDIRLYLEKHKMIVCIDPFTDIVEENTYQTLYTYCLFEIDVEEGLTLDFTYYTTYVEAREAGIIECLKIIKERNNET